MHIQSDELNDADPLMVAEALALALRGEAADLVLTGIQSNDQGFGQMGVALAELLDIPHSTIIMEVKFDGEDANWVRVKRELESGWFQWVGMPTPALLTIQSGINQLRYATLKGIMAAKKKKIEKIDSPRRTAHQKISKLYVPEKAKKTNLIEGSATEAAGELVRLLREDAVML